MSFLIFVAKIDELWAQCYKTFYGRNLRMFVISYSVCPWQDFPV